LNNIDLENLYVLQISISLLSTINNKKLQNLISLHLIKWINIQGNIQIWNEAKLTIFEIIELLFNDVRENILNELMKIRENLYTSSFDEQIRYSKYLIDINKQKIIYEILEKYSNLRDNPARKL
jgi:hypothetical protein